ncbi:MAG: helix-turn-helix domain-containing protein [Pseudomonadota bacterium]
MPESNRSLERGLALLDCFKPGVTALAHSHLVDRTGLPKATVTRLLTSLCKSGYLTYDAPAKGYRIGTPVLSLARAYTVGSALLARMGPLIREVARDTGTIVGVAQAHGTDMVYLDQVNFDRARAGRQVGPGQHLPIVHSAIGRAFLGDLPAQERTQRIARLRASDPQWTAALALDVERSIQEVRQRGHCVVLWHEGRMVAVGAPFRTADGERYALNIAYAPRVNGERRLPEALGVALQRLMDCARDQEL